MSNLPGIACSCFLDELIPRSPNEKKNSATEVNYIAHPNVLVRVPILSISTVIDAFDAEPGRLKEVLDSRDGLPLLAIGIGSLSLFQSYAKTLETGLSRKVRSKVGRFLNRMCARPTPYGLFAGVALARVGDRTNISVGSGVVRRSRPDMGWVHSVAKLARQQEGVFRQFRFISNPNIRNAGHRVFLNREGEDDNEISIRCTRPVKLILEQCQSATSYQILVKNLSVSTGADDSKIESLVEALWKQGFLLDDLIPTLLTDNPASKLAEKISSINGLHALATSVKGFVTALSDWDRDTGEDALKKLDQIQDLAKEVEGSPTSSVFQTDCVVELSQSSVSQQVAKEASRAAQILLRLTSYPNGVPHLSSYRQRFEEKYGVGREVPILELIDADAGLGPIVETSVAPTSRLLNRDRVLMDLATQALWNRSPEIVLTDNLIASLSTWIPNIDTAPHSLDIIVSVAASSCEAIDEGNFKIVISPNVGASSAGKYVARFSHVLGKEGVANLNDIARAEESLLTRTLVAELLFTPKQPRIANVLTRPLCRKYAIPVGVVAEGGLQAELISLHEIVVGVKRGRFYLRSARSEFELRVSNLHMLNHSLSQDVCKLLSELSSDGTPQMMGFDWGNAASFPYLPRVTVGKAILRPAEWKLRQGVLTEVLADSGSSFADAFQRYRQAWEIPRYVNLAEADNRLLLDLDSDDGVEDLQTEFRRLSRGTPFILLQEALPSPDQMWVSNGREKFASEFVFSLLLSNAKPERIGETDSRGVVTTVSSPKERAKPFGSEWLFIKLYLPQKAMPSFITNSLLCLINELRQVCDLTSLFFIRYADPEPHLRVRLSAEPSVLYEACLPIIRQWLLQLWHSDEIRSYSFDTYDREVERYGGLKAIQLVEGIFTVDTDAVIECLLAEQDNQSELDTIEIAVLSLNSFLYGLGLSIKQRIDLLDLAPNVKRDAGVEYRSRQRRLISLVATQEKGEGGLPAYLHEHYGTQLAETRDSLYLMSREQSLTVSLDSIFGSLMHMHCNRLLGIDSSLEKITMGLLSRTLSSILTVTPTLGIEQS